MAEKNVNTAAEEVKDTPKAAEKKEKSKKPNFFKKLGKFFKDTAGEMKKVVWTPKAELKKNTKLVILTVVAVGLAIALVDLGSSFIINSIAKLFG